jgi:F-type H+-transporting ATPase subunit b
MTNQLPEVVATDAAQTVTESGHGGAVKHVEPELFGLAPYQIVALAMTVLIVIMLWKRVPGAVTRGIDNKIAAIKQQLDEAKALRTEADDILAKAEADGKAMVARRERMAEDKIAAAEREAVESVRNRAIMAATAASRKLIAEKHGEDADRALADKVIAGL